MKKLENVVTIIFSLGKKIREVLEFGRREGSEYATT